MNETLRSQLNRLQAAGLIVGLVGVAFCIVGAFTGARQFFISYLFGYLFWLGLSLGCFGVAMIHYLTGGRWGNATRRFLEAGFMTLPLMAVLFIPIFFGLGQLYPWMHPEEVAADKVLQNRAAYMNFPAFTVRMIFFFTVWIIMAVLLRKWSLEQDETSDVMPLRRMRALSGPGVVIYPLTATFAYIDWVMSLEPDWYSTIFLVIICIGQILTAYAFVIILLGWFKDHEPEAVNLTQFHQLGNLLLTFVMFWTYVAFSQFLIIWSGNLPHEIAWYIHRIAGGWKWVVGFLALFHFFLPFFLLLFRAAKRNVRFLVTLAAIVFIAHIVEVFWVITPSFYPDGIRVHWNDFAAFLGVGGVWIAAFVAMLKRAALLPQHDPRVQFAVAHA